MICVLALSTCLLGAPQDRVAATEDDLQNALRATPKVRSATYSLERSDHFDETGQLVHHPKETAHVQLNCTTFATPILHRLVRGGLAGFRQSSVNGYGDRVAAFYGLTASATWTDTASAIADLESPKWREQHAGVHFFDLRKGGAGHVGFLVLTKATVRQVHFSGMKRYDGLADDTEFLTDFLKESQYRAATGITLYRVTKPK